MAGGGLGVARNEVIDERLGEAGEIGAGDAVFEPGEGRGTRQGLRGIERYPLHAQFKHGIMPEAIGIIAIGIPGRNLIDTLSEQVTQGMVCIRRMALVMHGSGQAFREADLAGDPAQ